MHAVNGIRSGNFVPFSLLLAAAFLCVAVRTKAIEPLGDNSELFITGVVTVSENDNIFLSNSNPTSSEITDLTPGLSYEFGKTDSQTQGQVAYYEDFQFFSKSGSQLDNQLGNFVFSTKYDDAKTKLNLDATWHQADEAEVGIQNLAFLVDRDLYHIDGTGEVQITEKSSIGTGVVFDDTTYNTAGYANYKYVEVPVDYYFKVEPKLDLSAGFRYRSNTVGGNNIDSNDFYYNVGARGEFTPKLTGEFDVGYLQRNFDNGTTASGLGADSHFVYAVDPKNSVTLSIGDDYTYFPTGLPVRNLGIALGATSALSEQWSITGQLGYNHYAYITTTQIDNYYPVTVGVKYVIAKYLTVSANYTHSEDSSNVLVYNFRDDIFSVSASLHY